MLCLVAAACETGGRWIASTATLLRGLAHARARDDPGRLKFAAARGWEKRWWALISIAAQDALAATLVDDTEVLLDGHDGVKPVLGDVILCDHVVLFS